MRNEKSEKYKELKGKRNTLEYESWFLRYVPFEVYMDKQERRNSKVKSMRKTAKSLAQSKTKSKTKANTKAKTKTRKNLGRLVDIFL